MIALKRAYDPPDDRDGERVLVDRLWPRGVRREALALSRWEKDVAPSPALRAWFGHDPARWDEFRRRYRDELRDPMKRALLEALADTGRRGTLTLLYAARDAAHNHALVLKEYLETLR